MKKKKTIEQIEKEISNHYKKTNQKKTVNVNTAKTSMDDTMEKKRDSF